MGKRTFEEAAVVATGSQTLQDRFAKRRRLSDYERVPPIARWRCNLTGLSQVHNLYFVAYTDNIYVYEPHFPTQALSQQPALVIASQPSDSGRQGYLDPRHPHAINNLVVQFLGKEEVVAVVRDDGYVDAFLVRHIMQAIARRAEPDTSIGVEAGEIRPFLQSNVGMSAWGLAIHSEARIIAVSANTHAITIFKFGLDDSQESEDEQDGHQGPTAIEERYTDVTYHVINGISNIPHIAFCNTGDDPHARWLLITDIGGLCRSVDLRTMKSQQAFRFARVNTITPENTHDRFNGGWAIMFLDRRSFIAEDNVHSALGLREGESLPGIKTSKTIWDIGATASQVPDTSIKFTKAKKRRSRSSSLLSPLASPRSSGVQSPQTEFEQASVVREDDAEDEADTVEDWSSEEDSESGESTYGADLDFDDEGTEDTVSFSAMYGGRRICGIDFQSIQPDNNLCGDCPCPILHTSVRNVYLLQPSSQSSPPSPMKPPIVGFTNALHQLVQGEFSYLNAFERLNFNAYIPTIGIVVLASQKGRALILSLTKLSKSVRYPPEIDDPASRPRNTTYAMRMDKILPFAHQEEAGQRPFAPLAGLATGPLQGTADLPAEQQRWRLMMMYADHTILSYEISRRARGSGVDIRGIVV